MEARGLRGPDPYLPHLMGHEGSGVVVKAGRDVTKVKPGDHVVLTWIEASGLSGGGGKYERKGQKINAGRITTFNNFAVLPENRVVKLPKEVPLKLGWLFGCAILTGSGIVRHQVKPKKGDSLGIFGLGGIGLSALMAAVQLGCDRIIAFDPDIKKRELALELGATETIDPSREDVAEAISSFTSGKLLDYTVEASGLASVIETAFKNVRDQGGRCVFATHPKEGSLIRLDPFDLIKGKRIEGSWGGGAKPDSDVLELAPLMAAHPDIYGKLLGQEYELKDVNKALDQLEGGLAKREYIAF